jgi:hypothetical protein
MSAPAATPCPSVTFWATSSYRDAYGTTTVWPLNIVRDTGRRVCVRLMVSEDFGAQSGYARSWRVRPERRTLLFWCDSSVKSPAARYVRVLREEYDE